MGPVAVSEKRFQWCTQRGELYYPEDMETRHLFMTVRMIWNHTAKEEKKLRPFKLYTFGPRYTQEYMREAVRVLSGELAKRWDMEPRWISDLRHIYEAILEEDNDRQAISG